jgi:hypothetical protein
MYKIESISVLYDINFKERIQNIRKYEPNIKILTNQPNDLDIEVFITQDKYELIEQGIKKYKNTLFLDQNYRLKSNFFNFETQKDLGLIKNKDVFDLECIFCENLECISYLKNNNLNHINFKFNFLIISKNIVERINVLTSLFIHCNNNVLRQSEYLTCLNKNIQNPEIEKIYYFKKEKINDKNLINKDLQHKLEFIEHEDLDLQYQTIFDFIEKNNIKGYKIISFPDVYFKKLDLEQNFTNFKTKYSNNNIYFSLSAYNVNSNFELGDNSHFTNIYNCINHKALIFENNIKIKTQTKLGNFTSISYITNELNKIENNYILNIPDIIKIFHLDNIKKQINKKEQINSKYLILPSLDSITFGYIKYDNEEDNYKNYNKLCKFLGNYIKIVN